MSVIIASLKKELREALRDRRTILLTVLVPMILYPAMIFIAGGMGAKQQKTERGREIKVGYNLSPELGSEAEWLTKLQEGDRNITWLEYEGSDTRSLLTKGNLNAIIQLTSDKGVTGKPYTRVTAHYVSTVRGEMDLRRVRNVVNRLKSKQVSEQLGKVVAIEEVRDYASVREQSGSRYGGMAGYFIVFLALTGCMSVAVDATAGEKERGTLEPVLVTPAPFAKIALGKLMLVVVMGLLSVLATFVGMLILLGASEASGDIVAGMSLGDVGGLSILGMIALLTVQVLFFAVVLFGLAISTRSIKEAHIRASFFMLLSVMLLIYCTLPGVDLSGGTIFVPILNVALTLKGLWEGSVSLYEYFFVMGTLLVLIAGILYWLSKRVERNAERVLLRQ